MAVEAFHGAMTTGDTDAMLALAPEARLSKLAALRRSRSTRRSTCGPTSPSCRAVPRERSDLKVVGEGNVAWVVSASRAVGTYRGREIDSRGGELMVLARNGDGVWKIRSISWS